MKHNAESLVGFTIGATDGEIGKVKEFYFDDETWTIRYLIVDTGNWLSGRVVLISPDALLAPDWKNKTFPVNLTKEQIRNSPDINTDLPVSRQEEIKLHKYYPWVAYWAGGYYGGGSPPLTFGADPLAIGLPLDEFAEKLAQKDDASDKHLRSTKKVKGYKIKATDGEIGDVEDFILGENMWKIDFILIDTAKWIPGKKVLISPKLISKIEWDNSTVSVETTVAFIKTSPEYDPSQMINVVNETHLNAYYDDLVPRNKNESV